MSINREAVDDLPTATPPAKQGNPVSTIRHRRRGSESAISFSMSRPSTTDVSPRGRPGGNIPHYPYPRHRATATSSGFFGWKNPNENSVSAEDDGIPKLVSLSDLIRDAEVPATLLYEPAMETGAIMTARDLGKFPQHAMHGGTVGAGDALKAAEHGDSIHLSKFLQDGGDPETVKHLHHMRWSLLHLAAGCATMGGRPLSISYRSRPEPDCTDGYATCVSELLAAGADPNVASSGGGGVTPLMSAAWAGSKDSCALLLRAGAQVDKRADDGWTAIDFALNVRGRGTSSGVLAVLRDPPKKVPRSPTTVRATLVKFSNLEPEDAVPPVELRWRVSSQASLAPTTCGDVERYYIKCWCRGKGKEVIMTKTSTEDMSRRDFCRNQIIERGIALRKNLCLPQSQTASTIVHGLQAGEIYSFTVSCVAEVEGALRHSPPSCMSKPLHISDSKEDHNWPLGGIVSMVKGKETPSPVGPGDGELAHRGPGQQPSPIIVDQRRGTGKGHGVSWAKDESERSVPLRHATGPFASEALNTSPSGRLDREWQPSGDPPYRSPMNRRSQSHGITTRIDSFAQASSRTSNREVLGGQGYSPPHSSPPLEKGTEGLYRLSHETSTVSPVVSGNARGQRMGRRSLDSRSNRGSRSREHHNSFQVERCNVS